MFYNLIQGIHNLPFCWQILILIIWLTPGFIVRCWLKYLFFINKNSNKWGLLVEFYTSLLFLTNMLSFLIGIIVIYFSPEIRIKKIGLKL